MFEPETSGVPHTTEVREFRRSVMQHTNQVILVQGAIETHILCFEVCDQYISSCTYACRQCETRYLDARLKETLSKVSRA